jgi:hypothetical protein
MMFLEGSRIFSSDGEPPYKAGARQEVPAVGAVADGSLKIVKK